MSRYAEIFNYMRQCPRLKDLWSIAGQEELGNYVILPQGASETAQYSESIDVRGGYECDIIPFPSVYEDYQINCFQIYDVNDGSKPENNTNVMSIDEVQEVIDWVREQDENNNFPKITGNDGKTLDIISIECNPIIPQVRYVDQQRNIIAYFITVRIRYVNTRQRKFVEYGCED